VKRVSPRVSVEENGFAILPDVFTHQSLDCLLQQINELAPRRSRAGLRHGLKLAPIAAWAQRSDMMDLARAVLGPNAFPFRATLFDKSPDSNWLVVWHQDTAVPLRERLDVAGWGPWSVKEGIAYAHAPTSTLSQVVALRISIDDSTVENGPLRVLPGTHTRGVLSDDEVRELATHVDSVDCVVPKGGVLIMRPLLIHASSKSQSEAPRRVLHVEYAASDFIAQPLQLAIA
jgi:ectoine hydroxylase-related dioxygenase (phytanoyl-CoA dioxygenase family)